MNKINYSKANNYWKSVRATENGMLGGFEILTKPDVEGSLDFIAPFLNTDNALIQSKMESNLACDCGAGIGRVSKHFLLKIFNKVDIVEQNEEFIEVAKNEYLLEVVDRVDRFIALGLQDFTPDVGRYDLIWCQWVTGYLPDAAFVDFLKKCITGLNRNGLIGIKDNTTRQGVDYDEEDSSVTRPNELLLDLFRMAGLKVVKQETQKNFPPLLYPVIMYLLIPINRIEN